MKSYFSYWSSTACIAKKASGGACASVSECMVNVGLECTGGICQCINVNSKYVQNNLFVFKNSNLNILFSYWSANSICEVKKSYGAGCASSTECLVSQGLSCISGICQCSSTK